MSGITASEPAQEIPIGKLIKQMRECLGYSQLAFVQKYGYRRMTQGELARIENGCAKPAIRFIKWMLERLLWEDLYWRHFNLKISQNRRCMQNMPQVISLFSQIYNSLDNKTRSEIYHSFWTCTSTLLLKG